MNWIRLYRGVAFANLAAALLVSFAAAFGAAPLFSGAIKPNLITLLLPVGGMAIAAGLAYAAIRHLRRSSRRTALALAANSAIVIWFAAGMVSNLGPLAGNAGQWYTLASLLAAGIAYRLVLRPAAIRGFPPDQLADESPPDTATNATPPPGRQR